MDSDFSYQFYNTTQSAWDAMYQALQAANESIYWEVYTLSDDLAGRRFLDLLCQKAQSGVEVKLIFDSIGTWGFPVATEKRLKQSGVELLWYNHLRPQLNVGEWWKRLVHRNHRKVLIIDQETVFVGGVNVELVASDWDDIHLKITGPMSKFFIKGFVQSYLRSGGDPVVGKAVLKKHNLTATKPTWKDRLQLVMHSPLSMPRPLRLRRWYDRAFEFAKERITLLTPYYRPDPRFLHVAAKAKRRGVKVDVLLPLRTDIQLMRYLSEAYYTMSERAGIKLHFLPRMNHGKALSIDNELGMVGSINFTPRSFLLNEESGIIFKENRMVKDLNTILNQWKEKSLSLASIDFHKRGFVRKVLNRLSVYLQDYV